ncbi:MAG: regulator of chromosome condensation, partial [Labilithrix sp.]|nr:regulator of chromosome condensation [Labilithrix sp.]
MKVATIALLTAFAAAVAASSACDDQVAADPIDAGGGGEDAALDAEEDAGTVDAAADARERPLAPARSVTCAFEPCAVELVSAGSVETSPPFIGPSAFCARLADGSVRCWGSNLHGLLARGDAFTAPSSEWPEPVVGLGKVSRLTGSMAGSFCALGEDGYTKCWGSNSGGQIGRH